MINLTPDELRHRADRLRHDVDELLLRHGPAAGIVPDLDPIDLSLDDIAADCAPTLIGSMTPESIDAFIASFGTFSVDPNDPIVADVAGFASRAPVDQLQKARSAADDVTRSVCELVDTERRLRAEVDELCGLVAKGGKAGRIAAEQKRLLLEKVIGLLLVAALIEAAKRCLLQIIERLDKIIFIFFGALGDCTRTAGNLRNITNFAIGRSKRQKNGLIGFQPGDVTIMRQEIKNVDDARKRTFDAIRMARKIDAEVDALRPQCTAFQILAALILSLLIEAQKGLGPERGGK